VGKRFFKVTGSIAAAVGLIFLGNVFTDDHADGFLGDVRERLLAESGGREADGKLRRLTSAEADFRANDRDWNHVNDFWKTKANGTSGTPALGRAETTDFESFFGRDLSRTAGFHVHFTLDHDAHDHPVDPTELASRRLGESQGRGPLTGATWGGDPEGGRKPAETPALGLAMKPAFSVEDEKLGRLTTEKLSEPAKAAKVTGMPPVSTLAVANDALEAKAAIAGG